MQNIRGSEPLEQQPYSLQYYISTDYEQSNAPPTTIVNPIHPPCMAGDSWHSSIIIRADDKTQESPKWLFLGNLIPKIESKAPN